MKSFTPPSSSFPAAFLQSDGFARRLHSFGRVRRRGPRVLSGETNVVVSACRNDGGAGGGHRCGRPHLREQRQGGVQHHPRAALLLRGAQDRSVPGSFLPPAGSLPGRSVKRSTTRAECSRSVLAGGGSVLLRTRGSGRSWQLQTRLISFPDLIYIENDLKSPSP